MTKTPFGQFESPPAPEKKKPAAPGEKPAHPGETPPTAESETVAENFETKKKEMVDQVEETFEKHISAGSEKIDERALSRIRGLKESQKRAIAELFERRRKSYEEKAKQTAANREALASELLKTATDEAQKRISELEAVIREKSKEKYISTDEAYEIEKAVLGVEKLAGENKQVQEVSTKMAEGRELDDKDYAYIVGILNPYDIYKQRTDLQSTFEATSAGVLIGLMRPDQRYRLIETFMSSGKKAQTAGLIDGFLKTGILSRDQGEALFQEAVKRGIITQEQFMRDFKTKLDAGAYEQEVAQFKKILEEEKSRDYRGVFSDNIMNRISERPLAGGILALWGLIVMTLNIAANRKEVLKSPYFWAGAAGVLAGTEIATGAMKKGAETFGAGVIGRGLESLGEPAGEAKKTVEKNAREKIGDIIFNAPKDLVGYLDNGGFATLWALRGEKMTKHEKPVITIDELLKLEKNPQQIQRLQALKQMPMVSEQSINVKLTFVAESAFVLKVENNDDFTKLVAELRQAQMPKGTAVAEGPASTPGPKPPVKTPFRT